MIKSKSIKVNDKVVILKSFTMSMFLILIVAVIFKVIRHSNLLTTEISKSKIVGFAHFFNYPLYLDTVLFFLLILIPPAVFIFFRYQSK